MISILLVTHGLFSAGILNGAELVFGPQEDIEEISLKIEDNVDDFAQKVAKKAMSLDNGEGVLIFVDMIGGSPANVVGRFIQDVDNIECISGLNLPMLLEALATRNNMNLKELKDACIQAGKEGILDFKERMKSFLNDDE